MTDYKEYVQSLYEIVDRIEGNMKGFIENRDTLSEFTKYNFWMSIVDDLDRACKLIQFADFEMTGQEYSENILYNLMGVHCDMVNMDYEGIDTVSYNTVDNALDIFYWEKENLGDGQNR